MLLRGGYTSWLPKQAYTRLPEAMLVLDVKYYVPHAHSVLSRGGVGPIPHRPPTHAHCRRYLWHEFQRPSDKRLNHPARGSISITQPVAANQDAVSNDP